MATTSHSCGISTDRLRAWRTANILPVAWHDPATQIGRADLLVMMLLDAYHEQVPSAARLGELAELLFRVVATARDCAVDPDLLPLALIHAHLRQADIDQDYPAVAARFALDPAFALFSSYADYRAFVDEREAGPDAALRAAIDAITYEDINDLELFCDLANPYYSVPAQPQDVTWAVYAVDPGLFVTPLPPGAMPVDPTDGVPALGWVCLAVGAAARRLSGLLDAASRPADGAPASTRPS